MKKFLVAVCMAASLFSSAFAGPAPAAYYWDILGIASTQGSPSNVWENVEGSQFSTSWDHNGVTYAVIGVLGYSNPVTTYNNSPMQLVQTDVIDLDGDNIADGWYYYYMSNGSYSSGTVEIKDWLNSSYGTKDSIYVK